MPYTKEEQQLLLKVGDAIRSHRRQQKLSQEIFARQTGISRSYFASIERGEKNISVLNLTKIAKALGVEVVELLEGEENINS
jgi:transcriptional regulator with XRE-family HTH domain